MARLTKATVTVGLEAAIRYKLGEVPSEGDLAAAPVFSAWVLEPLDAGYHRFVGTVTGHPVVPDGVCFTSAVLYLDNQWSWPQRNPPAQTGA
jgi:hypothetical protein